MKIPVEKKILSANDQVAEELNQYFHEKDMLVVNFMASPGAGKTSLILATLNKLSEEYHPGVIEGDLASSIDADKIKEQGTPVVQINTGGNCHLDAPMIRSALPQLPMDEMNMLFIENVGNLVCTANFSLGADLAIVVASVSEGHDKPYKYPGMFANADAVVLNKSDLIEVFEFDVEYFKQGVRILNPEAPVILTSCKTGEGLETWIEYLTSKTG